MVQQMGSTMNRSACIRGEGRIVEEIRGEEIRGNEKRGEEKSIEESGGKDSRGE